ncbi:O-antigen ligase family protein [Polynucleobacter sp. UB-Siik-W21]|uniref:O-antigen ligase family protein n=1 Tax=Polynucleobacter sp. UB-Siik-W21 TaxID=1855646 RepID=UPI001BFD4ACD|nr:O-antigen ligase family protein [Polynucleobacter sp. UB-Siik-W21]QWD70695.1 O-antigen ligase family protein [Polynucleobacter sp. UB-Siik-W21]
MHQPIEIPENRNKDFWLKGLCLRLVRSIYSLKTLELLMILGFLVAWIVWPLRGTIAARNFALVVGAISSISWILIFQAKFKIQDLIPIILLMFVPIWLLVLYIDFPRAPALQWDDLSGTWLRVVIGSFFAIGLGKLYIHRPQYRRYFWWVLFIWPIIVFMIFLMQGIFTDSWSGETFYIHIFKSKVAGLYFLAWSLIFCFSTFHYHSLTLNKFSIKKSIYVLVLFLLCIVDFVLLQSLNGFIAIIACFSMTIIFLIRDKPKLKFMGFFIKTILFIVAIIYFITATVLYNTKGGSGKLINLKADIRFILSEDATGAWKWDKSYDGAYPPINPVTGNNVNGSTYERVTWFQEGIKILIDNPLGLGYTGQAFAGYMSERYPGSRATKTHSGWLDFGLGVGFPGLFAIWLALGVIFFQSRHSFYVDPHLQLTQAFIFWAILIMNLLWLIAEFSDREYIEHFFFVVTFFSIVSASYKVDR